MGHEKLVLIPLGKVDTPVLVHLRTGLTETFGHECRTGEVLPAPGYAYNPRRAQYAAEVILDQLRVGEAERVLGIVDCDLYVPELNFVFGLADRRGGRALIALPRLRERFYGRRDDDVLFLGRVRKEAVHELGHACGLRHCSDRRCVMAFSNSLADTDYKGQEFCPGCRKQLAR